MNIKKKRISLKLLTLLFLIAVVMNAQIREYRIHDRGMLHETVFNTGEIGRAWMTGEAGNKTNVPLFEWPSRSRTFVEGIEYSGQHNILGAGVYVAANLEGVPGKENRLYSFCGGVGQSSPEVSFGRWSFPLSMSEVENFPIIAAEDGTGMVNPDYDPNEAEEVITASWASSLGITFTRTSRAWSYPDYDDMIIYEYELVYTGDTDGNPATIERDSTLVDFMVLFNYGFAPSMYGYQRHYQEWKYDAGIYRGDQHNFWDADYWLGFNLTTHTGTDDFVSQNLAAKPEPNRELFKLFAETGLNGGGLSSPQAPGYCFLYFDKDHLAVIDTGDAAKNESEAVKILRTSQGQLFELDENNHIKQPWSNKVSTGNTRSSKMRDRSICPDNRWSGVYSKGSTTWAIVPNNDTTWWGRAAFNYRQSVDAGMKHLVFGPYTINPGDTLRYALAEVVGYGAEPGKLLEGGPSGTPGLLKQWNKTPNWNRKVVIQGETMTEKYLDDYGYPDYVNSDVKTVTQVAHKAFRSYLGAEPTVPIWPENNPDRGSYDIPVPVPAPVIQMANTDDGNVSLRWNQAAENFTHPNLMGQLENYIVLRSIAGMGPWNDTVAVVSKNDVGIDGFYEVIDTDNNFKVGEERWYSVISVDEHGNVSGKTNLTKFEKNIGSVVKMDKVYAVPNPFRVNSGFVGEENSENKIGFYGLPEKCTIRIFSYSGQLVETIHHDEPLYTTAWFQLTKNGQDIASGIYFFVVTASTGEIHKGKFVVIK